MTTRWPDSRTALRKPGLKNGVCRRGLYEDWSARISILAGRKPSRPDTLKQTDQPPISTILLQTGRAIRFLKRAQSCCRWPGRRSTVPRPSLPATARSNGRPRRWVGAGQSDQLGFPFTVKDPSNRWGLPSLAAQRRIQPSLNQLLANDVNHRVRPIEGLHNLAVAPALAPPPTHQLQQDLNLRQSPRRDPPLAPQASRRSRSSALNRTTYLFTATWRPAILASVQQKGWRQLNR